MTRRLLLCAATLLALTVPANAAANDLLFVVLNSTMGDNIHMVMVENCGKFFKEFREAMASGKSYSHNQPIPQSNGHGH
jgi:hypothetical protein